MEQPLTTTELAHQETMYEAVRADPRLEGAVVTRWVAVYEVIEPDGTPALYRCWNLETPAWTRDGMLEAGAGLWEDEDA